jgi:hypothetical protein
MAQVEGVPTIELRLRLIVSEAEAEALAEIAGYSDASFVEAIEKGISPALAKRHGAALRQFISSLRKQIPRYINAVAKARHCFHEEV